MSIRSNPPLHVVGFYGTTRRDTDRGPQVRLNASEARARLLDHGELAWIQGPRRSELAAIVIDDAIPAGGCVLRDIAGVAVSEVIRLQKPDYDTPPSGKQLA